MTKFRCSNNKLPANQNRFSEETSDKLCNKCDLEDLGDEFHYLFKCNFFERNRKMYIQNDFTNRPNTLKMKELFNSTDSKVQSNLCKFISVILSNFDN